jgi:hypothetical protein
VGADAQTGLQFTVGAVCSEAPDNPR